MNKILNSKLFSVIVGIVVLWLVVSSISLNFQRKIVDKEVRNAEAKVADVQRETDYLNKFLDYFKTSDFLEREARLKLNYKDKDEKVVFVYKDKNPKLEASDPMDFRELIDKMPNYKKWMLYLLGY